MIKLFEDWRSDNEIDPAVEKIVAQFESWATSMGLEHSVRNYGKEVVCDVRMMGYWTLKYEKSTVKGGQDSMYRQTYTTKDNYKWSITYPGRSNTYNYRSNTKTGNLKTFKGLIERFMKVKDKFELVWKFLDLLDHEKYGKLAKEQTPSYDGKNLKDLYASLSITYDGTIYSKPGFPNETNAHLWKARYINSESKNDSIDFDPETAALFYYALLGTRSRTEPAANEDLLAALERAKDKPLNEVWNMLKDGKWETMITRYAGSVAGKKFNL